MNIKCNRYQIFQTENKNSTLKAKINEWILQKNKTTDMYR